MIIVFIVLLFLKYVKCCIYQHFPSISSSIATGDYDERKPRACRWKFGKTLSVSMYHKRLDRLTSDVVCWIPYGDHLAFKEFEPISLFSKLICWIHLLSYTDQRGLCDSFGMYRTFHHTLLLHVYL